MKVLFCSLQGTSIWSNCDLNKATSALGLPPLYLLSKDTALLFCDNEEDADDIIQKGTLSVGSICLVFTSGVDKPSNFLEIHLSDSQYESEVIEAVRQSTRGIDILISSRKLVLLLQFKNSLEAVENHTSLLESTKNQEGVTSISLVAIAEFCLITCRYHRNVPLRTIVDLHLSTAQVIEDLRNAISTWLQQPTIVKVHHSVADVSQSIRTANKYSESSIIACPIANLASSDANSMIAGIVIICPTKLDRQILLDSGIICLPRGNTITMEVDVEETSQRSSDLRRFVEVIDNSPTKEALEVKTIGDSYKEASQNLQTLEKKSSCKKVVTKLALDLECYAIANYFKLLVKWGQEAESLQATLTRPQSQDGKEESVDENNTALLWGEESDTASRRGGEPCSINVILENKAKNYGLEIISFCSEEAEARLERMKYLASIAVSMRQTIPMRNWCPQHREAINESDALRDILNKTKSAVLFHESKDKVISADVVGLTQEDQKTVRLFLEALIPRQAEWNVPQDSISDFTASSWTDVRRIFAIKLDVKGGDKRAIRGISGGQKNSKSLKVWGFEPAMEKALKFILTPTTRKESHPYIQKSLMVSPAIMMSRKVFIEPSPGRANAENDVAGRNKVNLGDNEGKQGDARMKSQSTSDIARCAIKDKAQFVGHFVFLDREAGMLYQAFEFEFQTYILQKYNVMMRSSLSTQSESGATENNESSGDEIGARSYNLHNAAGPDASSLSQFWTPALKVEYTGSNKADIISVRSYMEKIGSTNLPRQQIHFPRYDATRYRELYNQKTKQEANLRLIRRLSTTKSVNEISGNRDRVLAMNMTRDEEPRAKRHEERSNTKGEMIPDPLVSVGFINIRIRPPLHSRGIRRMTFPAEITVTICSPVNTSSQLADYTTLCEHFASMDSHYITASVEMPLASKLAKEIIVRSSRNEFVAKYGLVSLRWDENTPRRDYSNKSNQDGNIDDTTTDGCNNSFDEPKKGDAQMGVAKLWATRPEIMRSALDRLCKSDGVIISVSMGDDIRREATDSDRKALTWTSLAEILPPSSSVGKYRLSSPHRLPTALLSPCRQSDESLASTTNSGDRTCATNETDVYCPLDISPSDFLNEEDDALSVKSLRLVPPGFEAMSIYQAKSTKDLFDFDSENSNCSSSFSTSVSFDDAPATTNIDTVEVNEDDIYSNAKDLNDPTTLRDQLYMSGPSIDLHRSFHQDMKPTLQPVGVKIAMPKFDDINPLTCLLTSIQASTKITSDSSHDDKLSQNAIWGEHTALLKGNEKSSFAVAAAPGFTIPTDWDFILQKTEWSTTPASSIPRALTPPFSFKKFHPQTAKDSQSFKNDAEQLLPSSQSTLSHSYASVGFSSTSTFGASFTSREAGIESHLQDDFFEEPSTFLSTRHFRDADTRSYSFDSSSIQYSYGRNDPGTSIFNDSLSLGRRKSLDLGDIATGVALQNKQGTYDRLSDTRQYLMAQVDAEMHAQSNQYGHPQQALSRQQQIFSNVIENRFIVHWPHPSFRFMFLVDPLKYQLSDLLHKFRARGVGVSTPFRDKSAPSACLVIDGTHQGVSATRSHVESFFRSVILLVKSVKMVLTATQRERLTSADLLRVKEIQGSAGAHIILDPQLDDIANALSCFDIRLPYSDHIQRSSSLGVNSKMFGAGDTSCSAAGQATPLIAVRITSQSGQYVEVTVIPSKISSWLDENVWNVRGIIMMIDSTSYARLKMEEKEKVDAGKVLINHDPISGRTVIRVCIRCKMKENQRVEESTILLGHDSTTNFSGSFFPTFEPQPYSSDLDAESQAGALIEAISDGLATSDALSLTRVALIIPTGNTSLSALSPDLIRTVAVESLVNFLKGAHLQYLQKIVCVEIIDVNSGGPHNSSNVHNSLSSRSSGNTTDHLSAAPKSRNMNGDVGIDIDSNETALRPANDNRMALTLLLLLDQANRECQSARDEVRKKCYEPNSLMPLGRHERECFYRNIGGERIEEPEFQPSSSPIQLIVCNIPLPCSLSAETVCPDILAFQCQQRIRDKAATSAMATASNSAYSGLGFLGNVQPSQPVESVRYTRQREYPREQISDYRNLPENGPCVIVLRGLSIGILRAVRAIKQLVATKL